MSQRLTVLFNIKDGEADNFKQTAQAAIAKVKAEDEGCEMYDLFQSVDDPQVFVLVESWASQDALDAHGKSAAMQEMNKIGPFLAGRPTMHRYED